MNPLVKKEIRLLLPSWLAVLLLAIFLPWFLKDLDAPVEVVLIAAFFGVILLGVDSFGREFSLGTFQSLLAQPVERRRVWRTKITVLLFAVVLVMAGYFISDAIAFFSPSSIRFWRHNPALMLHNILTEVIICGVVMLVALVGGLWTTLLLRQASAAFWITFLIPLGFSMLLVFFLPAKLVANNHFAIPLFYSLAGIYIVFGFWLAHRLYHRAQDAAWTGGVISFSRWRYFESGSQSTISTRRSRPIAALVKKELQLQSISLFCATALLALHVAVIVMRKVHGSFEQNSMAGTASEFFWTFWLIIPLIIGGTMAAEERRLGVAEGQFCLPASRRLQFALKFCPALIIGIVMGGFMPLLLEVFAAYIGAPNPDINPLSQDGKFIPAIMLFVALPLGLSLAGFFASTLAKNFLQALGTAVVIIIGCVLFTTGAGHLHAFLGISWNPPLTLCVTILTTLVAVPWLAWRNFNYFQERGRVWRRNGLGLATAILFIFISSAALYNRAWEVFEPAEPAHGPAKKSLASPPALSTDQNGGLQVRLPDGRVWFDYLKYPDYDSEMNQNNWLWLQLMNPLPKGGAAQWFLAGSNWRSASVRRIDFYLNRKEGGSQSSNHIVRYLDTVGVKADGTLWISDVSKDGAWNGDTMNRFGYETNWQQLVRTRGDVLLLKNNGTLWRWDLGTNHFDWSTWLTNWPTLRNYQRYQIGADSDWKEIRGNSWNNLARKADGSVWDVGVNDESRKDELSRDASLDPVSFQTFSSSGGGESVYVRPDGTLWMRWLLDQKNGTNIYSPFVQIGTETNWTAVSSNWRRIVALKSDGSLWQWDFSNMWDLSQAQLILAAQKPPTRLGTHHDWVAIASTWQDVVALAADGSLWLWPNRYEYEQYTLLKLPKQPKFLGNVFGRSD